MLDPDVQFEKDFDPNAYQRVAQSFELSMFGDNHVSIPMIYYHCLGLSQPAHTSNSHTEYPLLYAVDGNHLGR